MKTTDIAPAFVDLALKYDWRNVIELPTGEIHVLFAIVSAAGFEPSRVIPGKLRGNYLDQDGSRTGETYPINSFCPYKVVSREDTDHYTATGWLDCTLQLARRGTARQQLIQAIQDEIERSVPLKPIQLTPEGDMLREYPPSDSGNHTRDDRELSNCVGVHDYCNGWVDRNRATKTHDALSCRRCRLRVLFPQEIKTYGELRQALTTKFAQVTA